MARRWWTIFRTTFDEWLHDDAMSMGAALAFYAIFALAPLIVLMVAFAGSFYAPATVQGEILTPFARIIGPIAASALQELITSTQNFRVNLSTGVGTLLLLVAVISFLVQFERVLDRIWHGKHRRAGVRRLFRERLVGFALLFLAMMVLISLLFLTLFLNLADAYLTLRLGLSTVTLEIIHAIFSFCFITIVLGIVHKSVPASRIAWSDVWPGAIVTALLFVVGQLAISFYLSSSSLASSFGVAGAIGIIMLWLYYSAQLFLIGAEFTKAYAETYGSLRPRDTQPIHR